MRKFCISLWISTCSKVCQTFQSMKGQHVPWLYSTRMWRPALPNVPWTVGIYVIHSWQHNDLYEQVVWKILWSVSYLGVIRDCVQQFCITSNLLNGRQGNEVDCCVCHHSNGIQCVYMLKNFPWHRSMSCWEHNQFFETLTKIKSKQQTEKHDAKWSTKFTILTKYA